MTLLGSGSWTVAWAMADQLMSAARTFFFQEVPDLLAMSAEALRKAPFPASLAAAQRLSRDQIFQLVPVICALVYATTLPFCWVYNERHHSKLMQDAKHRRKNSYWLTRVALLRGVALCYLAAFSTSAFQARALFGRLGLQPVQYSPGGRPAPAFWLLTNSNFGLGMPFDDWMIEAVSWTGVLLSLLLLTSAVTTALLPALLWLLYLSIVNWGGWTINYGWEWLTLELGFLAIFLCPLFTVHLSPFPRNVPPPRLVLWLFRWCAFRLLFGAGMSKLGGNSSACWKQLTCTTTHYFTQPMPNPLAWYFHHLPAEVHSLEVLLTFLEQLVLPFAILLPLRSARILAALSELFLQAGIVGTGNYAWINLVGVVPCLALLDDHFLSYFFSSENVATAASAADDIHVAGVQSKWSIASIVTASLSTMSRWFRTLVYVGLVALIAFKSTAPLKELYGPSPWLHFYDDYFLVSAQGVFGFINSHRPTLVLSYTHQHLKPPPPPTPEEAACRDVEGSVANDQSGKPLTCAMLAEFCDSHEQVKSMCRRTCGGCKQERGTLQTEDGEKVRWKPLEFKNLPGDPAKAPGFNSPYHYRLDWQVWIHTTARLEQPALQGRPLPVPNFVSTLIRKVLAGDTDAAALLGTPMEEVLRGEPVATGGAGRNRALAPPSAIKAEFYWYTFSKPGSNASLAGKWWERKKIKGSGKAQELVGPEDKWDGEVRRGAPQRQRLLLASTLALLLSFRQVLSLLFEPAAQRPSGKPTAFLAVFRASTLLVMLAVAAAAFVLSLLAEYPSLVDKLSLAMMSGAGQQCYRGVQAACQVGAAGLAGYVLMAAPSEGARGVGWCCPNMALVAAMWWLAAESEHFHGMLAN